MISSATGVVRLQLNGQKFDVQKVAADTKTSVGWQFPQSEGKFIFAAVLENGTPAECRFYTYASATPSTFMRLLPHTYFPNAKPYDTFEASAPQQREDICLDDAIRPAFTYAKVTLFRQVVAQHGFYDTLVKTAENNCCTPGIKVTE